MKNLIVPQPVKRSRHGGTLQLAAGGLVVVLGMAAFAVDLGYIALAKAQLQTATDAAALGAALDFDIQGDQDDVSANVRDSALQVASLHRAGGMDAVTLDWDSDMQLGQAVLNPSTQQFEQDLTSGKVPYNLVKVRGRLKQIEKSDGTVVDARVPLFFARFFGHSAAEMEATATAAVIPGVGFRIETNSKKKVGILPFALDLQTWLRLVAGVGPDVYLYDAASGHINSGADGILEVNLYPEGSTQLPPGNRGTVDLGSSNNSTADIVRQIEEGMNADDFAALGGEMRTDLGPLFLDGDTGISAGFKEELAAIVGETRAIPIFESVSGVGDNAVYKVVKFVGIRVLAVRLTGKNKYLIVQPAHFSDSTVIRNNVTVTIFEPGTILTTPQLIR